MALSTLPSFKKIKSPPRETFTKFLFPSCQLRKMSGGMGGRRVAGVLRIVNLNTNGISQLSAFYCSVGGYSLWMHLVLTPGKRVCVKNKSPCHPSSLSYLLLPDQISP